MEKILLSEQETYLFGVAFGEALRAGSVLCLFGELGAGKTTFIKGVAAGAGGIPSESVSSPTFVYLNIYQGSKEIYHFDLYRLRDVDEFLGAGFEDYLETEGVCCIEWSEKIEPIIPPDAIRIYFEHYGEGGRRVIIQNLAT